MVAAPGREWYSKGGFSGSLRKSRLGAAEDVRVVGFYRGVGWLVEGRLTVGRGALKEPAGTAGQETSWTRAIPYR